MGTSVTRLMFSVKYGTILSLVIQYDRVLQVNYMLRTFSFDITDCRTVITLALKI